MIISNYPLLTWTLVYFTLAYYQSKNNKQFLDITTEDYLITSVIIYSYLTTTFYMLLTMWKVVYHMVQSSSSSS